MQNAIENNVVLELAYLYPELLNIYGDKGNVLTLIYRCRARGITLNISSVGINDVVDINKFDIYVIGGGQDQQQVLVSEDIRNKSLALIEAIENNAVFLTICGGYQLLGQYYRTHEGFELKGVEALDLYTIAGKERFIGNVLCKELENNVNLVGFENHSGKTYLGKELSPLAKIIRGAGNNGEDGFEGVRYKNIFGTYLHGSLLPKNPFLADKIISLALERKGYNLTLSKLDDDFEIAAYNKAEKLKY